MFTAQVVLKTQSSGTLLSSEEITGATQQELQSSAEDWAQQTLHEPRLSVNPVCRGILATRRDA